MSTGLLDAPGTTSETSQAVAAAVPVEKPAPAAPSLIDIFGPQNKTFARIDWVVLGWIGAMHVGCLAAPFFFTWQALVTMLVLHWATASIGICLTYHRCLSHRSLKLRGPARFFTTLCAVLSGEGSPLMWCATHRVHHARSDHEGDPHSPNDGTWWSHIIWTMLVHSKEERRYLYERYTPDLLKDRILVFFDRTYGLWLFGSGIALYAIGGWPFLLWGLCVRMVLVYHGTWFVNSATHIWGYRNYETTDRSRNLWWVALWAYGEGWHNNHHAHPRLARAGHKWWEFDMTFYAIRALQFVGLAYDVDDRIPKTRQAAPAE